MGVQGDVADRDDVGIARLQALVDDYPVGDVEACALRQAQPRGGADTHNHRVGLQASSVGEDHSLDGVVLALDGGNGGAEVELDAVVAMEAEKRSGDLRAESRCQWKVCGLDDGDRRIAAASRSGDLEADPPAADDHDVGVRFELGSDRIGVLDSAQEVDAGRLQARDRQHPGL
jgi:hypothetical protein